MNGSLYAIPFANLLPSHTDEQRNGLREAIQLAGRIIDPVTTGITSHGRTIIDGVTRARIAIELGLPVPTDDQGELTDAEAQQMAEDLNVHRRHLTPHQYNEYLNRQIARKRFQGQSVRKIAGDLGIPLATTHRMMTAQYVKGQVFHSGTPPDDEEDENEDEYPPSPSRIIGADGKSYPARRPEPTSDELLKDLEVPSPREAFLEKLVKYIEGFEQLRLEWRELDVTLRKRERKLVLTLRNDLTAMLKRRATGKRP